jgi:hypothetical protein
MTRRFLSLLVVSSWLASTGLLRAEPANHALARASVLENNVAYLRAVRVEAGLPDEIAAAQRALAATNPIAGTVLDLRFADGDDLAAAKATSGLFAANKLPLAILVNSKTRGAAAALATDLREARDGLVFGGATADLKPDIAVKYLENPYAPLVTGETNVVADTNQFAPFIDHTSEADLVREKIKDGDEDTDETPPHPAEPQKPYIHDPVLGRAVDWIKALAELRVRRA